MDRALRWIRHCCVCGKIAPPIDFLCVRCEIEIGKIMNSPQELRQADYPFPVYSLFTWTRENDHFLRPVLYGLKGGFAPNVLNRWLEILTAQRMHASASPYRPIFVIPPRAESVIGSRTRDHGWLINQSLAAQWRTSIYDGLELKPAYDDQGGGQLARHLFGWAKTRSQKHKSRGERLMMRFAARGELKEFHGLRTTVFADDVITTGATALAAYLALDDPHSYEVWTLACRPKLARSPRV